MTPVIVMTRIISSSVKPWLRAVDVGSRRAGMRLSREERRIAEAIAGQRNGFATPLYRDIDAQDFVGRQAEGGAGAGDGDLGGVAAQSGHRRGAVVHAVDARCHRQAVVVG